MRYAIYGAGSLGTVLGAYITKNGGKIDLINRNKRHIEALNQNGAIITGTVSTTVPVTAYTPDKMSGKYDVILLMTKQQQNREVVTFLKDYLADDGVIVTLQNGLPEPLIAEIVGENRTMGCVVEWGATLFEPGVCVLTSSPDSLSYHMGRMKGISDEKFNEVKNLLELMCPVHEEKDLLGVRWSKLLINATFSGIGTALGGTFGTVAENKESRRIAVKCLKECIDVGHASGVEFAPVQGKNITKLFYYTNPLKKAFATLLVPIAMKKHRNIEPSMLQDIKKGKACEIDTINGIVCEYGRKYGVETPVNDKIVEIVKRIESGELKPEYANYKLFSDIK